MLFTLSIVAFVCLLLLCESGQRRSYARDKACIRMACIVDNAEPSLTAFRTSSTHPAALWTFRRKLIDYLPDHVAARFRDYVPVGTFEGALQGGFNSSTFDLSGNLESDQRQGLDEVLYDCKGMLATTVLTSLLLGYLRSSSHACNCGDVCMFTGELDRSPAHYGHVRHPRSPV